MLTGCLVLLVLVVGQSLGNVPLVETKLGKLSGRWELSRSGRKFAAFNAIPFAKPPIGKLRFQAPKALDEKWFGTLDVSAVKSYCPQQFPGSLDVHGSEDCLYLSVATHNVSGRAPVLVHIHGGGFASGHSSGYGHGYLMDKDLVVVGLNYRLGVLGFLSLEDDLIPGNQGMKDQVMGLRWVKENIHLFGGNPGKVTLIGESAGSASIFHHTVSPLSRGLFQGAIAESGTSYAIWALSPIGFPRSKALEVMKALNCSTNSQEGVRCVQGKHFEDIVRLLPKDVPTTFGPVFEKGSGAFLTWPISQWQHSPVPLLTGVTSAEGLLKTAEYATKERFDELSRNFDSKVPLLAGYYSTSSSPGDVTRQIRRFYNLEKNITLDDWVNVTNIFSDSLFFTPAIEGANRHTGPVYFYFFDFILKELTPHLKDSQIIGAFHTTEAFFIWNITFQSSNELIVRPYDVKMSRFLIQIVADFATNGALDLTNSTGEFLPMRVKWEKWTNQNNAYIHINGTGTYLKNGIDTGKKKFWESIHLNDKYDKGWNNSTKNRIPAVLVIFGLVLSFFNLF